MKKLLICASLMAFYGTSVEAVTFKITDAIGEGVIFEFLEKPSQKTMKTSRLSEGKQINLLDYFHQAKGKTLEIRANNIHCGTIHLEDHTPLQLNSMIITAKIVSQHDHGILKGCYVQIE